MIVHVNAGAAVPVTGGVVHVPNALPSTLWLHAVAVYPLTAAPPVLDGAIHATCTRSSSPEAVTVRGGSGTVVRGVADTRADHADAPSLFTADTSNQYPVPFVNPVTAHTNAGMTPVLLAATVQVRPATAVPPEACVNVRTT